MPYVISDLGVGAEGKIVDWESILSPTTPTTPSGPTLRPWPGADASLMTRTCYPPSTLAMLGTQPRQVAANQQCPSGWTEAPTAPTTTAGKPAGVPAGTSIQPVGIRFTPGAGVVQLPSPPGKPPVQPTVPTAPPAVDDDMMTQPPPEPPPESWLSEYKWFLIGGGGLALVGIIAVVLLLTGKKAPATSPTSYISMYEDED